MSVLVKKLPISHGIEIHIGIENTKTFLLPKKKAKGLIEFLKEYEVKDKDEIETLSAEEVFPKLKDATLRPAVALRGARNKENLSQQALAKKVGITQGDLSKMEHGKRPIGRNMAKRLAKVLNVNYKIFL